MGNNSAAIRLYPELTRQDLLDHETYYHPLHIPSSFSTGIWTSTDAGLAGPGDLSEFESAKTIAVTPAGPSRPLAAPVSGRYELPLWRRVRAAAVADFTAWQANERPGRERIAPLRPGGDSQTTRIPGDPEPYRAPCPGRPLRLL